MVAGRGIVIGQCSAPPHALTERLTNTLRTGDTRPLMSLPGAYSAVLVTVSGLTLVADSVGQFPIYYRRTQGEFVFGTRAELVAANASFDLVALAAEIACPQAFSALGTRTNYSGVHQLLPGTALRISTSGTQLTVPSASLIPDTRQSLNQAADELHEVLQAAVIARAPQSADFSGGFDSTSLAFLAARLVPRLTAVTVSQRGAPVDDDLRAAAALARLDRRLTHRVAHGDEHHLPYQHPIPGADAPHPAVLHRGPLALRLSNVAESGSAVHLVGEGGDQVLTAPHAYLADLARRGAHGELWRHCVAWARLRHRSPTALFVRSMRLAAMTSSQELRALARQLDPRQTHNDSWEHRAITVAGHLLCRWLMPRTRVALAAQLSSPVDDQHLDVGDQAAIAQLRSACRAQHIVREFAAAHGIAVHAPFLDPEVARVCMSVPAWRRADPQSVKPLLRRAMASLVPDAVFTRTTKGNYTATAHLGVRHSIRSLHALLADPLTAELGLIEPGPVRDVVNRAARGIAVPWAALNQVLAVEIWLRDATTRGRDGTVDAGVHRPRRSEHHHERERAGGGPQHPNRPMAHIERDRRHDLP
ncbi:albusnodin/ikarugamycin family macrolactam cyclase [Lentzea terrae]|uniref:albusnodin/ikarugamycin family macrolactam cyclase n=1 Tax=Lentzea terrae TaxID=2200761 RepID=UPI001E466391|nr:albusnodin/ikarugamycin family macrolactam cyclase [Lentzea terrae]